MKRSVGANYIRPFFEEISKRKGADKMTEEELKKIEEMPKAVLHLHLDGSLRPETVYEWLKEQGEDVKLEEVQKALMVDKDCRDLNEYLEKFDLPSKVLQTEEHIEQATFELFEDLSKQNVIYSEVRFAPSKHIEDGLTYNQVVEAAIRGMNKAKEQFEIDGNLILCCMRGDDNKRENIETLRATKEYLNKGVCALDLAGAEALFPTEDFEDIFKAAKDLDIPFTIHAGEAAGPESIKKALEMGTKRIGHGVRCLEDGKVVGELVEKEIPLEVCPISNLQTKATGEKHPIEELYKAGLKTTISPDNNTVSNTDIIEEYKWILENTNLTVEDLEQMNINAIRGAFITPQRKAELIGKIKTNKDKTIQK